MHDRTTCISAPSRTLPPGSPRPWLRAGRAVEGGPDDCEGGRCGGRSPGNPGNQYGGGGAHPGSPLRGQRSDNSFVWRKSAPFVLTREFITAWFIETVTILGWTCDLFIQTARKPICTVFTECKRVSFSCVRLTLGCIECAFLILKGLFLYATHC